MNEEAMAHGGERGGETVVPKTNKKEIVITASFALKLDLNTKYH
jgi:hypothetical protein